LATYSVFNGILLTIEWFIIITEKTIKNAIFQP